MESGAVVTRREFMKLAAVTGIAMGTGSLVWAIEKQGTMPYRTLGCTGSAGNPYNLFIQTITRGNTG